VSFGYNFAVMTAISRRDLFHLAAALAATGAAGRSANAGAPTSHVRPPAPAVAERVTDRWTAVPFESQSLGGVLAERIRTNVEGRLLHVDEATFLSAFIHRDHAGEFDGAWVGEHAGKFLDAACNALRYQGHPALRASVDRVARALIASQAPDGYLGTYPPGRRWSGWDVWVHKYNLIGLLSYYELTGDEAAIGACRAMGDLLCNTFGDSPGQRDIIAAGEHVGMAATSVLEPMCRLYRFSADSRHLVLCRYVVRAYDQPDGPRLVSSLLETGSVYRTANGKAYEMLSNFNGLVDLYRLTGEKRLLDAVLHGWDDIVRTQVYYTGTVSAREHFQPEGQHLTLQSSNVGETCATVTWLQLNWRLLRLTGEARFGQEIERTVYNHLLAAQDPRNGNISYYTSWFGPKEWTHAVLCCVSSGPRGISLIPQLVWGVDADALVINLYTPGRAQFVLMDVPVQVTSETAFPADGHVKIVLTPERASRFTLRLRVPEWTTAYEVSLGTRTFPGKPGQMLDLLQTWEGPTTLHIRMDMTVRVLDGGPTSADYALIQRGPQVLALERSLNPDVPYLERVSVGVGDAHRLRPAPGTAYDMDAMVGVPASGDRLRYARRTIRMVPFANLVDGSVWLTKAGRERQDRPAATAFARASVSVVTLALEPTAGRPAATDIAEFITDEDPNTSCTVNPQDPSLATYLGAPAGKRGDPVWFLVRLASPANITRIVFRQGAISDQGGWLDTSQTLPRIEIATAPIPTSSNEALPEDSKVKWELAALLDMYPRTDADRRPDLATGQTFEVILPGARRIYGLRLVAHPGGAYASCAGLSAY
jgi:uncharacterized protein